MNRYEARELTKDQQLHYMANTGEAASGVIIDHDTREVYPFTLAPFSMIQEAAEEMNGGKKYPFLSTSDATLYAALTPGA